MSYDAKLPIDDKLAYDSNAEKVSNIRKAEICCNEEQAAPIQTVPRSTALLSEGRPQIVKTDSSIPQRKISSRLINAFNQLYTMAGASETGEDDDPIGNRTTNKCVESKLLSMWHNVKYGWNGKLRSNFSKEQPVWLLGRCYHRRYTPPVSMENSMEFASNDLPIDVAPDSTSYVFDSAQTDNQTKSYLNINPRLIDEIVVPQELGLDAADNNIADNTWEEGIEGFRRDFYSRIWMTYRREFPIMNGTNYTSDCGWGCMLRSGQMLLAQGLVCHFLGRNWRYDPETQLHNTYEDNMHKRIIKWFGDSSSKGSPFSIHALVQLGERLGKKPGDWYGPASVSYLLKHALENAAQETADFDNICIYVASHCTVYLQDVEDLCIVKQLKSKPNVPWQLKKRLAAKQKLEEKYWKSLIVLIPLRLGTEKLNTAYAHCLKLLLSTEYCLGIIGGRPKHSLYFVGFQEDKLIHMDPHYCQEMVDVNQETFQLNSFHCDSPRKIKTNKMDPSCCVGFYCATKSDFDNFIESVQTYLHPMRCASGAAASSLEQQSQQNATNGITNSENVDLSYPLFSFSPGRCLVQAQRDEMSDSLYKPLSSKTNEVSEELNVLTSVVLNGEIDAEDAETEEFVLL